MPGNEAGNRAAAAETMGRVVRRNEIEDFVEDAALDSLQPAFGYFEQPGSAAAFRKPTIRVMLKFADRCFSQSALAVSKPIEFLRLQPEPLRQGTWGRQRRDGPGRRRHGVPLADIDAPD